MRTDINKESLQDAKSHGSSCPSDFTPALAELICFNLMEGMSLRSICSEKNIPSRATIFNWLIKGEKQGSDSNFRGF